MAETTPPQLYLTTPAEFELAPFGERLKAVLDAVPVACLRLDLATRDEGRIARAADALREIAHPHDVAVVIASHLGLVEPLGLDGVHLSDGARSVRAARKALGADRIVGAFCGASRHDGLNAAEAGADYVAFGPTRAGPLGTGTVAEHDLFAWWSEMIEVPVVAEEVAPEDAGRLLAVADFVVPDTAIWEADDPADALRRYAPDS